MKRTFLAAVMAAASVGVYADVYAYPYLIFTDTNGGQVSLSVTDLVITVSGGQLIATNSTGTQTFTLSQLASMQFSASADGTVGIGSMADGQGTPAQGFELYDLSGRCVMRSAQAAGAQLQSMQKGVYVVRTADGRTSKITVK